MLTNLYKELILTVVEFFFCSSGYHLRYKGTIQLSKMNTFQTRSQTGYDLFIQQCLQKFKPE
jgi:hypothetical protein